ncbi:type I restriction endonuclease subunit R [Carnimonas bestiolae]|uniref:type I restriction endonuclease subunit R n=1 Tax=Carnimonas bestiolae TaxID=3402172 RepID=UPI003EDC8D8D
MAFVSEDDLEQGLIAQLAGMGFQTSHDDIIGPDGSASERTSYKEVILQDRLVSAIARINPDMPALARQDAVRQLTGTQFSRLIEENHRIHTLLADGVTVEFDNADGEQTAGRVYPVDFDDPSNNDWLAVQQFTVVAGHHNRRPDVVIFVNGLPLVIVELKAPGSENATIDGAFNQLQTYKQQIPLLFHTNALLVTSDGFNARVGSLSADSERFMPWRTTDGRSVEPKGSYEQSTLIEGIFEHGRFLDLLRHFVVFNQTDNGLVKIIAGYHQFHAVKKAVESTIRASSDGISESPGKYGLPSVDQQSLGDRRAGVIWHTQGSGKSLLMAFYAGMMVVDPAMKNPTLVIVTDRNDLDEQLFSTFSRCHELIRQIPVQAEGRDHLRELLNRASGGIIFTTLQKFSPEQGEQDFPKLTDRSNVIVIADEAHRSQYGFKARVDAKDGEISYGFAKYLRDGLPNASFIGFTGTPIESTDVNTPAVFGHYVDVYDISRAVEDGATVPIYYESRLARISIDDDERPRIDDEVEEVLEGENENAAERVKQKYSTVEALVGSEKRLSMVASDLVQHFEARLQALSGKGMVVCMSRRICVAMYNEIVRIHPEWHSDDDDKGAVKVVMTGSASDPEEFRPHVSNKKRADDLAKRARNPDDPLKLVIVRDMWLTGFDAPCMHTMYIDKPMKGHGLMQAMARVNRVFRDKPAGLVVDYIGIAQNLKSALSQYTDSDQEKTGIDEEQAVAVMLEKYQIVCDMFHGFDYRSALQGNPHERMQMMAGAIEWILQKQQEWAAKEKSEEGKKKAQRKFADCILALSKAFALASSSDEARNIRDEVGFFQAINAALTKSKRGANSGVKGHALAIQQIVSRSVISTDIIDIFRESGIQTPDISILSDEFLSEVAGIEKKNLGIEALRKLLNDDIRSQSRSNLVQSRAFSERLESSIARYHANALTSAEVLQELIELAKQIRESLGRGEEEGLSPEEIAFYDALAENESAVDLMGNNQLKVIAQELLNSLRQNVTVDWAQRQNARARIRVLVKRILRKYGYPPDLQDAAVQTVLKQAEALSASLSG